MGFVSVGVWVHSMWGCSVFPFLRDRRRLQKGHWASSSGVGGSVLDRVMRHVWVFGVCGVAAKGSSVWGCRVEEERAGDAVGGEGIVWFVYHMDVSREPSSN